jgi:hypothetical protein
MAGIKTAKRQYLVATKAEAQKLATQGLGKAE